MGLMLIGCAADASRSTRPHATLAFAEPDTVSGFPGSFRTLDGRSIPDTPAVIRVAAGRRKVGYWCPDTVTMDEPPSVTTTFESGKAYVLYCKGSDAGLVKEQ